MDHPCHRCGASVKSGSPFCKNCGAPQIRVGGSETEPEQAPQPARAQNEEVQSPAEQPPQPPRQPAWIPPPGPPRPSLPTPIHWSRALPAIILAALMEAIFSFLGLGILVGGFLSVSLYRRRQPEQVVTVGMAARLGAVAGGLGFFFVSIASSIGILLFHTGNQFRDAMMKSIEQAAARNPNPQAQEMLNYLRTSDGFALMLGLGLLATLIFYLLLSMIGGIIAAAVARRREHLS